MKINVIEYLQETVKLVPNKIAVIEGEKKITFNDLNKKAQVLATFLAKSGIVRKPIAVYLPKTIESVIADIAITSVCMLSLFCFKTKKDCVKH